MDKLVQNDGYCSFMKSVGTGGSNTNNIKQTFTSNNVDEFVLASVTDGIANNIATCVPEDSLSVGFEIDGDGEGKILKEITDVKYNMENAIMDAFVDARIYGGAIIVKTIADGRRLNEEAGSGEIVGYKEYSSGAVQSIVFDNDEKSPTFGKPKAYIVSMIDGTRFEIHASRVIPVNGNKCPDTNVLGLNLSVKDKFFGMSVFFGGVDRLKRMGLDEAAITEIMSTLNVYVTQFKDMNQTMGMAGDEGESALRKKCDIVAEYKSLANMIVLDADDKVSTLSASVAGVDAVMKMRMTLLAASFGLPMAKVYGETASGLANTGTGDLKLYYKKCEAWRNRFAKPIIEAIVTDFVQRNMRMNDVKHITFNPISVPTTEELVTLYERQANTYKTLIETGVITPETAKRMMFQNGHTFLMNLPKDEQEELNGEE